MNKILAAAFVLFLAASGGKACMAAGEEDKIKADPFYAEIVKAEAKKTPREMLAFFDEKMRENGARVDQISIWLRDHTIQQQDAARVDALYFMSYSDIMLNIAGEYEESGHRKESLTLLKSAVLGLYIYELIASADAMRCADKTVLMPLRLNTLAERLDALKGAYPLISKEDFVQFAQIAVMFEEKFADRPPNKYICSMGAGKMADLLKQKGLKKKDVPDPNNVGGKRTELTPPRGYDYQPKYIPDKEWNAKRVEIRDSLVKSWAQRYMSLAKAK